MALIRKTIARNGIKFPPLLVCEIQTINHWWFISQSLASSGIFAVFFGYFNVIFVHQK
jgi:hypothetical protein